MGPQPAASPVFNRTVLLCVGITLLVHIVTYLLNTQLPLQIVALGGSYSEIGWLFTVNTRLAMVLRPQVCGWGACYRVRKVLLAGPGTLLPASAPPDIAA